jgi:hypothetical protein
MTLFSVQEFIISGLYMYETRKILRIGATFNKKKHDRVMQHLIYVNVMIVFLDITLLALEYANLFQVMSFYKAMVYAIKLRFEFTILNQLVKVVQGNKSGISANPESLYGTSKTHETTLESGSRGGSVFAANPANAVIKTTEFSIHSAHPRSAGND